MRVGARVALLVVGAALVVPTPAHAADARVLVRPGRALTGPSTTPPKARAEAFVRAHASALGLTGADVDALGTPERTSAPGGLQQVRWSQSWRGIPVFRGGVKVNLDADGRVLGVVGGARHAARAATTVPVLSAADALRAAGATDPLSVASGPTGPRRDTRFTNGDSAALVLFGDRLAWRVIQGTMDVVVDGASGEQLHRMSLTRDVTQARVFDHYPGAPAGGTRVLRPLALSDAATTLSNDDIHVFSDLDDDDTVDVGEEIERDGVVGFDFDFTPFPCGAAICSWNPAQPTSWMTNREQNGVQAFYLANKYLAHLRALVPGFQADQLQIRNDDGASFLPSSHHDNADMTTLPEGQGQSFMRMFLWGVDSGLRAVNGGDDAAILFHEYTHELDNRLVHDNTGNSSLEGDQGGAMDEGMADFFAKSYLADDGWQPDTPTPGEVDMGAYTDAVPHQIRTEALDCPVGTVDPICPGSGYTYGDFGHVINGPEVHADGEIWAQTLWDLRQATSGGDAERLVVGGLQAVGDAPSFLDLRDAILTAATAQGIANTVWPVFARRGMGYYASTTGTGDTAPLEDFHTPPGGGGPVGTITGTVTDADTGAAVAGATVSINGASTAAVTTDAAGRYTLTASPEVYSRIVVKGPAAYDSATVADVTVTAGQATTLNQGLHRNWAALAAGAQVLSGDGGAPACGPAAALDGDPATGWSAQWSGGLPRPVMTLQLAGPVDLTRFEAIPAGICGDDDSAAARSYRIDASPDGTTYRTVLQGNLARAGQVNNLPLDATGQATARGTRFLRVTLLSPQDPTLGAGEDWIDLAELHAFGPAGAVVTVTPTPTPIPTTTPAPTATPPPPPPAPPRFSIHRTGKRAATFTVTCHAACSVTGKLTIDAKTARKLHLGRTRTIGTVKASLRQAGKKRLTVHLTRRAAKALKRVKRVTTNLKVSGRYGKARPVSTTLSVKIKR